MVIRTIMQINPIPSVVKTAVPIQDIVSSSCFIPKSGFSVYDCNGFSPKKEPFRVTVLSPQAGRLTKIGVRNYIKLYHIIEKSQ